MSVHDAIGRRVGMLFEGPVKPGRTRALHWDDWDAGLHPAGLYLIRAEGEHFVETRPVNFRSA